MKKEDADQLIRCVKECWWRVTVVLAVPSLTLVALYSDWPWKESPWAAASAVATLFAGISALWISMREIQFRRKNTETKAMVLAPAFKIEIKDIGLELNRIFLDLEKAAEHALTNNAIRDHFNKKIKGAFSKLEDMDISVFYDVIPDQCRSFATLFALVKLTSACFDQVEAANGVFKEGGTETMFEYVRDNVEGALSALNAFDKALSGVGSSSRR